MANKIHHIKINFTSYLVSTPLKLKIQKHIHSPSSIMEESFRKVAIFNEVKYLVKYLSSVRFRDLHKPSYEAKITN